MRGSNEVHCALAIHRTVWLLLEGSSGRIAGHRGHTFWNIDPVLLGVAPQMKLRLKCTGVVQGAGLKVHHIRRALHC